MPREESIVETGKQRSLRVPLDHYRWPNSLVRVKYWLTVAACVTALAYIAYLFLPTMASQQQLSPGPLAAVHGSWNNDCAVCHQNFQPLRADSVSLVGLLRGHQDRRELLDRACIKCHNTPLHHASAMPEHVATCATCHPDHRGAGADIVRASDTPCLNCHRSLESHRNGPSGLSPAVVDVTAFRFTADDEKRPHPDFRSLSSDPGNIKFNHWLHLQPGIAPAESKKKFRAADLPERFQKQYAGYAKTDGLVQLDCAACHEPDRNGAYMQPIAFEQHCQACHPQSWKFAEAQPAVEVPHGLTSQRLSTVLDGLVLAAGAQQTASDAAAIDESGNSPLIPGKTLGKNLAGKISQDALGRRNAAARAIATKCQECHVVAESQIKSTADLPDFLPSNVPGVWLKHARFDHRAHRHVECRACHVAAFAYEQHDKPQFVAVANGALAARDRQQVMIAGLESCANCHSPARGNVGGARFDCAECHKYHGGDTHASFPGSSLGTRHTEAPASAAPPTTPMFRRASFKAASVNTAAFTSASTCTSTGCHGDTNPKSPTWQTAFALWASHDPHALAYEVLWTMRGREMTRLLSHKLEPLTDEQHSHALEQRCVGCHATPVPKSAGNAVHFALGVQCESCHGAAGDWLHTHYQAGFRRDVTGFVDTKNLHQRIHACLKCHIGPSDAAASRQAVDHDLIAAGHPRLAFEFHSYFESLPAHWDRQKDESRVPDGYHFQIWLTGQQEVADWHQANKADPLNDFAQLECAACHHNLAPYTRQLTQRLTALPPPKLPFKLPAADRLPSIRERLGLARQLLKSGSAGDSWDAALCGCLAVRAITADEPIQKMADWKSLLDKLSDYLARDSFPAEIRDRRAPSPYDSPTDFNPADWNRRIEPFVDMLRRLESTVQ